MINKMKELSIAWNLYNEDPTDENKINYSNIRKELDDLTKSQKVDKVAYRQIHNAWKRFDRATAYGCANSKIDYNLERNQEEWNQYNKLLISLNTSAVLTAPIGLR